MHFSLDNKAISAYLWKSYAEEDPSKLPVTEAWIFRILYLAYKNTTLVMMTAGYGAHCKEKNWCNTGFQEKSVRKLSLLFSSSAMPVGNQLIMDK